MNRRETHARRHRVPSFTLYRDGTVVFVERTDSGHALRMWRMPEHEARDHIEHVRALGVARLRSYSHHCLRTGHDSRCISDAGVRVLRARLPDGALRELRIYAGFAPRLTEQLHAIYDRITAIEAHYQGSPLYLPRGATLFVVPLEREVAGLAPESRARMRPWPLDGETLQRAPAAKKVALEVPQIRTMIAAAGSNIVRDQLFVHGGRLVYASMIPWLPDADHREAIARARRPDDPLGVLAVERLAGELADQRDSVLAVARGQQVELLDQDAAPGQRRRGGLARGQRGRIAARPAGPCTSAINSSQRRASRHRAYPRAAGHRARSPAR